MKSSFSRFAFSIRWVPLIIVLACDRPNAEPSMAIAAISSTTQQAVQKSIMGNQEMAAQASPGAGCSLHMQGSAATGVTRRLFADEQGVVRFYMDSIAERATQKNSFLVLDCNAADGTALPTQVVDPVAAAALDKAISHTRSVTEPLQPALQGDPAGYSQAQLVANGFPPRPDPVVAPGPYAKWLQRVSMPSRRASANTVIHKGVHNGLTGRNNPNWAGPVLENSGTQYAMVLGEWNVPSVTADVLGSKASFWLGLDGQDSSDVCQAGTSSEVEQDTYQDVTTTVWIYYAWVEWYPNEEMGISFAVHPGDDLGVEVYVGDANGNLNVNGSYCWASFYNGTTSQGIFVNASKPSGTTFHGNTAEWIMERPQFCSWFFGWSCSYDLLADFGSAVMTSQIAYGPDFAMHTAATDSGTINTMVSGQTLAWALDLIPSNETLYFWDAAR